MTKVAGTFAVLLLIALLGVVGCDHDDFFRGAGSDLESLVKTSVLPAVERASNLQRRLGATVGRATGKGTIGHCQTCAVGGTICRSESFPYGDPDDPSSIPAIDFAYDACDDGDEYGSLGGTAQRYGGWTIDLIGPRAAISGKLIDDSSPGNGPSPHSCRRTVFTGLTIGLAGVSTATFDGSLPECSGGEGSLAIAISDEALGHFDAQITFNPPTIAITRDGANLGSCLLELETQEVNCGGAILRSLASR